MNCAALVELAIPPSLRYIGSRAFLDCTALKRLAKMPGKHKWRGVYAEENAFAICPDMQWPPWLHVIPDMGYWGGPLWRGRFLLGFLDPKLVSRKITFFDPLKEQKVWKTCEG